MREIKLKHGQTINKVEGVVPTKGRGGFRGYKSCYETRRHSKAIFCNLGFQNNPLEV